MEECHNLAKELPRDSAFTKVSSRAPSSDLPAELAGASEGDLCMLAFTAGAQLEPHPADREEAQLPPEVESNVRWLAEHSDDPSYIVYVREEATRAIESCALKARQSGANDQWFELADPLIRHMCQEPGSKRRSLERMR